MSLSSLSASLRSTVNETKGDVILTGLNPEDDSPEEDFVFQYFPENISDTKATNLQNREVAGGSLPLYQWVNSGERIVSFTAMFSCDVDYLALGEGRANEIYERVKQAGLQRRNVDIRSAHALLRQFLLPIYTTDSGNQVPLTLPPRKCRLYIPGSGIGINGGVYGGGSAVMPDSIICVMTQCDINIQALFPSGLPRISEVQLSFAQVPQVAGTVTFPQSIYSSQSGVTITALGRVLFGGESFLPYSLPKGPPGLSGRLSGPGDRFGLSGHPRGLIGLRSAGFPLQFPYLGLRAPEMMHHRPSRRAHVGAAAAFYAVHHIIFASILEPHLLRKYR